MPNIIPCLMPIEGRAQLCEGIFAHFEGIIVQKHPSGWVVILKRSGISEQVVVNASDNVQNLREALASAIKRLDGDGEKDYLDGKE